MAYGKTRVGKYSVPVRGAECCTIVRFRRGARPGERGDYCFWTAVLKRPVKRGKRKAKAIFGRAHVSLPPGDRFDRMKRELRSADTKEAREAYEKLWRGLLREGRNISYVRPSTESELYRWTRSHASDARYITSVHVA